MNSPKTTGAGQLRDIGNIGGSIIKEAGTTLRGGSNLGIKGGLALQAGIIDKYTGVLPETVGETASSVADKIHQILNIETDIPGLYDILMSNPNIAEFANDVQNLGNVGAYMGALALVHMFSKYIMQGEKGRFEATTSGIVWTALSVGIFKEMSEVLNGLGNDIMSWLPLRAFEAMPDSIRDSMLDADSRRNMYAGVLGVTGVGTSYLAITNWLRAALGRPKKKSSKKDKNKQ